MQAGETRQGFPRGNHSHLHASPTGRSILRVNKAICKDRVVVLFPKVIISCKEKACFFIAGAGTIYNKGTPNQASLPREALQIDKAQESLAADLTLLTSPLKV